MLIIDLNYVAVNISQHLLSSLVCMFTVQCLLSVPPAVELIRLSSLTCRAS